MNRIPAPRHQHGAALVVGLILLVVITVLAISGMNTATTELAMARNDQNYENAFQTAETGIAQALSLGTFDTQNVTTINGQVGAAGNEQYTATIEYEKDTIIPDGGFSLTSGMRAYHFIVTSTSMSARDLGTATDRDASAVHTQAFYIRGPQAPTIQ